MLGIIGRALTYILVWEAYSEVKGRVREGNPSVALGFILAAVLTAPVWMPLVSFMLLAVWYSIEVLWILL